MTMRERVLNKIYFLNKWLMRNPGLWERKVEGYDCEQSGGLEAV
jgi:hypothetical protein